MAEKKELQPTPKKALSRELLKLCESITAKRARTVIDHIFLHGFITSEDLSEIYGYDHPPRAIRDVRENGIPLITHKIRSAKSGRSIGAYTFDILGNIRRGRVGGRRAFPKKFKQALVDICGARDAFTGESLDAVYLQIDHRIPYEVAGDAGELNTREYMLLDAASQRMKSWSCEHCENWLRLQEVDVCKSCYWASPEGYSHIAMEEKRRVDVVWSGQEIADYERAKTLSQDNGIDVQTLIKQRLGK